MVPTAVGGPRDRLDLRKRYYYCSARRGPDQSARPRLLASVLRPLARARAFRKPGSSSRRAVALSAAWVFHPSSIHKSLLRRPRPVLGRRQRTHNHKLHLRVHMELAPLLPVLRHGRERLLGRAVRRGPDRDGDGDVLGRHLCVFCVPFHAIDATISHPPSRRRDDTLSYLCLSARPVPLYAIDAGRHE